MQPGVQVRKRAAKGAAAWLLTAGPRNRKPLSFHEIKPDSGLMKGRGGDSAGCCSGQLKFDLREGQQLVAAFAGLGAGRSQVRGHNRHLELGPKTYCRVWFGRPARGRWTEDGRRQARIRTRVWVDRWCHSWHTEGELACARFHAPWLDCSRLDTRSEEQEDEDSARASLRRGGRHTVQALEIICGAVGQCGDSDSYPTGRRYTDHQRCEMHWSRLLSNPCCVRSGPGAQCSYLWRASPSRPRAAARAAAPLRTPRRARPAVPRARPW